MWRAAPIISISQLKRQNEEAKQPLDSKSCIHILYAVRDELIIKEVQDILFCTWRGAANVTMMRVWRQISLETLYVCPPRPPKAAKFPGSCMVVCLTDIFPRPFFEVGPFPAKIPP